VQNPFNHTIDVFVDHLVCEAHHRPALCTQKRLALAIVSELFRSPVSFAIDLYDEAASDMCEVGDVRSNRVLPAKLEAVQVRFSKFRPQHYLRSCHAPSKFSGTLSRLRLVASHSFPSPA